jgi:hypothetical protein
LQNDDEVREEKKAKILVRLSIIVAPGKKGDIIVREGEEGKVHILVKNFIIMYGLKRDNYQVILSNLVNLLDSRH